MVGDRTLQENNNKDSGGLGFDESGMDKSQIELIKKDPLCIVRCVEIEDFSIDDLDKLTADPVSSLSIVENLEQLSKIRKDILNSYSAGRDGLCHKYIASLKEHTEYLHLAEEQYYNLSDRCDLAASLKGFYQELEELSNNNGDSASGLSSEVANKKADLEKSIVNKIKEIRTVMTETIAMDARMSSYVDKIPGYSDAIRSANLALTMGQWSGYPNVKTLVAQNKDYTELTAEGRHTKHTDKVADELCLMHLPVSDIQDIDPNDVIAKDVDSISESFLRLVSERSGERRRLFYKTYDFLAFPGMHYPNCLVNMIFHEDFVSLVYEHYKNLAERRRVADDLRQTVWLRDEIAKSGSHHSIPHSKEEIDAKLVTQLEELKHATVEVAKTDSYMSQYVQAMPEYARKVGNLYIKKTNGKWSGAQIALSPENIPESEKSYCTDDEPINTDKSVENTKKQQDSSGLGVDESDLDKLKIEPMKKDPLCIVEHADRGDFSIDDLDRLTTDPVSSLSVIENLEQLSRRRQDILNSYSAGYNGLCHKYVASLKEHTEYLRLVEEQYYNLSDRCNFVASLKGFYQELKELSNNNGDSASGLSSEVANKKAALEKSIVNKIKEIRTVMTETIAMDARISSYVDKIPGYSDAIRSSNLVWTMGQWSGYPNVKTLVAQNKDYTELTAEGRHTKHTDKVADELCLMHLPVNDIQDIDPNDVMTKDADGISDSFLRLVSKRSDERMKVFYKTYDFLAFPDMHYPNCLMNMMFHEDFVFLVYDHYENLAERGRVADDLRQTVWFRDEIAKLDSRYSIPHSKEEIDATLVTQLEELKRATVRVARTDFRILQYVQAMPEYARKVGDFYTKKNNGKWSGVQIALSPENIPESEKSYCTDESINTDKSVENTKKQHNSVQNQEKGGVDFDGTSVDSAITTEPKSDSITTTELEPAPIIITESKSDLTAATESEPKQGEQKLQTETGAKLSVTVEIPKQVAKKITKTDPRIAQYVEAMEYAHNVKNFCILKPNGSWSGVTSTLSSEMPEYTHNVKNFCIPKSNGSWPRVRNALSFENEREYLKYKLLNTDDSVESIKKQQDSAPEHNEGSGDLDGASRDSIATTEPEHDLAITTEPKPAPAITTEPKHDSAITTEPKSDPTITTEPKHDLAITTEPKHDSAIAIESELKQGEQKLQIKPNTKLSIIRTPKKVAGKVTKTDPRVAQYVEAMEYTHNVKNFCILKPNGSWSGVQNTLPSESVKSHPKIDLLSSEKTSTRLNSTLVDGASQQHKGDLPTNDNDKMNSPKPQPSSSSSPIYLLAGAVAISLYTYVLFRVYRYFCPNDNEITLVDAEQVVDADSRDLAEEVGDGMYNTSDFELDFELENAQAQPATDTTQDAALAA